MYKARKALEYKQPVNVGDYIKRELIIKNTPATVLPDGKIYRVVKGCLITERDFLKLNPPVSLVKTLFKKGDLIGKGIAK